MFKRIHWLSFIPLFIVFLALGSFLDGIIFGGITDIQTARIIGFVTNVIILIVSFNIARGISRLIYDKLERRRYFKEHREEDFHNKP